MSVAPACSSAGIWVWRTYAAPVIQLRDTKFKIKLHKQMRTILSLRGMLLLGLSVFFATLLGLLVCLFVFKALGLVDFTERNTPAAFW